MNKDKKNCRIQPLVSIGIPLFNEGLFIRQTLESLIKQDYENIEIIISDNGSSDETPLICEEFYERYPELIKYFRFDSNEGASKNFKAVLEKSSGLYFMWAGGHDLWSENYISECVLLLDGHEDAAVAFGCNEWIDESGHPFGREYGWSDTRGLDPVARYFTVLWGNMNPILGLIRKKYLPVSSVQNMVGADLIILCELALHGDFIHAPLAEWKRREHRPETSYTQKLERYKSSQYGLATTMFDRIFPLAKLPVKLIKDIVLSGLPAQHKLAILFLVLPTFLVKYLLGKSSRK
ncbi:MAG: glycosyltransferase involved in cell wall biosynthesis [Bermanella sp.]